MKPGRLFLVHTQGAEKFKEIYGKVEVPVKGREYPQ